MVNSQTREQFLNRYNTTSDSCGCPCKHYGSLIIDGVTTCKHIRAFNGERIDNWDLQYPSRISVIDGPQQEPPQWATDGWTSKQAFQLACNRGITIEQINNDDMFVGRRKNAYCVKEFIKKYKELSPRWGSERARIFARDNQLELSAFDDFTVETSWDSRRIYIADVKTKLGIEDNSSTGYQHWDEYYAVNFDYGTTVGSCRCPAKHFNPTEQCRHQRELFDRNVEEARHLIEQVGYGEEYENFRARNLLDEVDGETILLQPTVVVPLEAPVQVDIFTQAINQLNVLKQEQFNFDKEKAKFLDERNEYQQKFNLCRVCYDSKTIKMNCCNGALCVKCYRNIETKSRYSVSCPFCRAKMTPLVEVLMKKFEDFQV